ncbi:MULTISPECIES: LacI family DNA-binding transcriptional regulator [Staphylococcus]|uniref:LacI family DNA-binding transcriptional regulator n=1 Tax=Staphylococcus TaxID=1279 RepID=UPI0008F4B0CD|nr:MULTISPECIES: LacI family DNA-binding transcriptional regulator [Staphylococcus]OIJ31546.1 LacI family transcriptional regulator [Staphylococcus sp. LCT-H4]RIN37100.1 LacI family transcriptional regulator [Staphylococcus succinus]RIN41557.1 LacI family transcriptional regulator [Staphylococcus succinus]
MKPKLEDVAKLANVSKTTVSRVLNNRGYLSQATIDKVNSAMKTLNYKPNTVARQLYKKQTHIIGLLFPTVANPFFGELVEALEIKLYNQGYKVIIGNSMNDPEKEMHYLDQLLSNQIDGLIVGTHNQNIKQYENAQLPIVAIDRIMNEDIPIIESDNYNGGKMATERLIQQGLTKILHLHGPTDLETPANRRKSAYVDTMNAHHLEPMCYEVDFSLNDINKKETFRQILKEYTEIEGIFVSNDIDAAMILQLAYEFGKKVPDNFKIIGYDGTQMMRNIQPDLTTIIQPIDDMATTALSVLTKRLMNDPTKNEYVLPVKLWEGTTG